MLYLKADTAVEIPIGPAVSVSDGFTPVTTLSIASADEAELLKYNGASAITTSAISGTLSAISGADGYYTLDLGTGDVDTEGFLVVLINDDSLILPIRQEFMVVSANVYDSLFAASGTDVLDTNVTQWLGTAAATPTTAGVPEVDVTFWTGTAATLGSTSNLPIVDAQAISDNITAANNVESNIGNLDATVSSRSTVTTAEVNAEVDTALADIHLDHLLAADYDPASKPGTATALLNELVENDGGVSRFTTNALENAPGGAGGLTAADVLAQAQLAIVNSGVVNTSVPTNWSSFSIDGSGRVDVSAWQGTAVTVSGGLPNANVAGWLQTQPAVGATSGFPVVDSQAISDATAAADSVESNIGNLDAAISSLNDLSAAEVNTEVDTAIETYGLDHLVAASVAGADVTDDSIIAQLVSASATADWDDFDNTTDALQAIRDQGDAAWITGAGGISASDVLAQAQLAIVNSGVLGPINAPTNFDSLSIDGSGRVDVASWTGTAVTVSGGLPNVNVAGWAETTVSVGATSTFPVVDAQAISDDTAAADLLEALMDGAVLAQVNDGSATTTDFAADQFTEATDDHFNGRLITFVTGALTGQQTDITDYDAADGAQGSQQFTVTALTEAPANDDWFVIH